LPEGEYATKESVAELLTDADIIEVFRKKNARHINLKYIVFFIFILVSYKNNPFN
jgi:hypothetical protein